MSPETLQSWQHVSILCQLYLRLGSSSLGTHGEDVKDERSTVENLHLQFLLDISDLLGREFIVEDHHTYFSVFFFFLVLDVLLDFLQLTLSHIGGLVRRHHLLRESLHGDGACGICKKFQLVEIFLGLGFVLCLGNKTHQHSGFRLDF